VILIATSFIDELKMNTKWTCSITPYMGSLNKCVVDKFFSCFYMFAQKEKKIVKDRFELIISFFLCGVYIFLGLRSPAILQELPMGFLEISATHFHPTVTNLPRVPSNIK
jgi:hypothetical protein